MGGSGPPYDVDGYSDARLEPRRGHWRAVRVRRDASTLVPQTVGAGVVGPDGAAADRHDHLRSGHLGHHQRWRRTSHHAAVDNHTLVKHTGPDNHTVVDPPDHHGPAARDDAGTRATARPPNLDAATSSSPLVERQRAADTRITPVPRPGAEPVAVRAALVAQQG